MSRTRNNKKSPRKPAKKQEELSDTDVTESELALPNLEEATNSNFEVEAVVGKQYDIDGNVSYLLHWKSWDGEPTWEPEENCSCKGLIAEFEKNLLNKSKTSKQSPNFLSKGLKKKSPLKSRISGETKKLRRITRNTK